MLVWQGIIHLLLKLDEYFLGYDAGYILRDFLAGNSISILFLSKHHNGVVRGASKYPARN
jgi:hypothetical protein